jgi:hypothetical protein
VRKGITAKDLLDMTEHQLLALPCEHGDLVTLNERRGKGTSKKGTVRELLDVAAEQVDRYLQSVMRIDGMKYHAFAVVQVHNRCVARLVSPTAGARDDDDDDDT